MNVELITSIVDLDNYRNSKNFIATFQPKNEEGAEIEMINKSLSILNKNQSFVLASSLSVDSDFDYVSKHFNLDESSQKKILSFVKRGVLSRYDTSHFSDYNSDEFSLFLKENDENFRFCNHPSKFLLMDSLYAAIKLDGIRGHCFLIDKSVNLLAYPHEGGGFGFICLSKHKEKTVHWLEKYNFIN